MNHENLQELLPLFVLGALEAEERAAVEAHVAGCPSCREEQVRFEMAATEIAYAADPVTPPARLREAVLRAAAAEGAAPHQVWKSWSAGAPEAGELHLVRADEGSWEIVKEGIAVKRLAFDAERRTATMLVRMEPGSRYPRHRHAQAEECYVLSGELRIGDDLVMRAGDFQRAGRGTTHVPQWTLDGCLLLISSSLEDELLV